MKTLEDESLRQVCPMNDLSDIGSVLVIEDEYLVAVDTEVMLTRHGVGSVELVRSVVDALDRISQGGIGLATVDVRLADGDCDSIVEALAERAIPFIFVSGFVEDDCTHKGKAPWVNKPVAEDELIAAVREVTSSSAPRNEDAAR